MKFFELIAAECKELQSYINIGLGFERSLKRKAYGRILYIRRKCLAVIDWTKLTPRRRGQVWLRLTQETVRRLHEMLKGAGDSGRPDYGGSIPPMVIYRDKKPLITDDSKQAKTNRLVKPDRRDNIVTYPLSASKKEAAREAIQAKLDRRDTIITYTPSTSKREAATEVIRVKTMQELWDLLKDES